MSQKQIEDINHNINVEIILKILWTIKDNDQFYFNAYGKDLINKCINQMVKKEIKRFKNAEKH